MNITKSPYTQQGSALFIIMIGVALFAALSYAVAQMLSGGGGTSVSKETSALNATEIIDYGRSMRLAVQDLKISNGCDDTDISFENNAIAGYVHSPTVPDGCKVFNPSGGGVNWIKAPNDKSYEFSGARYLYDIGTTGSDAASRADLYMGLEVDDETCRLINDKLGVENPSGAVPNIIGSEVSNHFTGNYGGGNPINHSSEATGLAATRGKYAFCGNETGNGNVKRFIQVLLAR